MTIDLHPLWRWFVILALIFLFVGVYRRIRRPKKVDPPPRVCIVCGRVYDVTYHCHHCERPP
jgi:hypothetical protein